ncbi:undecaprenyldiphospho-muramoylpentapeptide beta-N-acetylglucosaminyltransferase [Thermoanaerobacterium sp. RBIITD]|uniref:undecaprenyldiphospho-muramoylpentapeptide beta-N-acetylglucosaminyltransferase n=1 Tax=Thermoanaerobacterium sp. RBIITD TaxID=1550240 RepID=UPI000BB95769|nr:undecaprenyldiphospho-muramoylpentapeptide beta-N-acetylglucosaminyltransferase [Thermoanaerobacterium sp. RBIITD]SNX52788.1 UDP-N-acetylglucosamine-N-acetylmuramylpentapeptide N-acetylglucosamine transferase [Thermoanaerobacterium sp. RBIITD]
MKYLMTGGGTGGHIYPAIAIANEIRRNENDADILFVGTEKGLEKELVPKSGYVLRTIRVKGFKRKISLDTIKTVKIAFDGLFDARRIINEFKPDIVIGTGGYVCGPVVMMAVLKHIPTLIHEQNAFPGITNRILSRFVNIVATAFEDSKKYFHNKDKVYVTGNPVRLEILNVNKDQALKKLGLVQDKKVIVSVGGSRGAAKINECMVDLLKYINDDVQILIITGKNQYDTVIKMMKDYDIGIKDNIKIIPYCYNMEDIYAVADIMICRSGAITLAELTATKTASILIPSPNVTHNHQEYNARVLEKNGAALIILEKDLSGKILYDKINSILKNPVLLEKMKVSAKKMSKVNAANDIYKLINKLK